MSNWLENQTAEFQDGFGYGYKQGKADAIEGMLDAMKKSIISLEVRDRGADYSSVYRWVEMIAEQLKEQTE